MGWERSDKGRPAACARIVPAIPIVEIARPRRTVQAAA